jgi:hypothetical protein
MKMLQIGLISNSDYCRYDEYDPIKKPPQGWLFYTGTQNTI